VRLRVLRVRLANRAACASRAADFPPPVHRRSASKTGIGAGHQRRAVADPALNVPVCTGTVRRLPGARVSSLFDPSRPVALLALADGTVFRGISVGAPGSAVGEVVFNTALTGYQEILTDPSYCRQIVTLTYPHIGNVGTNDEDDEAGQIHAAGLVVRDVPPCVSNFRARRSLGEFLRSRSVVAIAGIDTRRLTRLLRDRGAQPGALVAGDDAEAAVALARTFPGMSGLDLAKVVSVREPYEWTETAWSLGRGYGRLAEGDATLHVVAYDFGIKRNILRLLAQRGCRVTVVPATTPAAEVIRRRPDGVFLSNGPGDPEPCDYAIDATRELIERGYPTFGICLGHQIMGLASGGRTLKMKFGHHGANHPVQDLETGRVLITSQNHGFAVDAASLPPNCKVTHMSLFDGSLQGFRRTDRPAFCFQGHPEASPGPHDLGYLFDRFAGLMAQGRKHAREPAAETQR
jgi:carbamoyl-phosphate synthase small subunit